MTTFDPKGAFILCALLLAGCPRRVTVGPVPISITSASAMPGAVSGAVYPPFLLTADGGAPPYHWQLVSGTLPDGLILISTGTIQGTPSATGDFSFEVEAWDSQLPGARATRMLTITIVNPSPVELPAGALLPGVSGTPYSMVLNATGGIPPYGWTVSAGGLPSGLFLDSSSGAITGTPNQSGIFPFDVTVTDSQTVPDSATQSYSITIASPGPRFSIVTQGGDDSLSWMTVGPAPGRLRHRQYFPTTVNPRWCALTPSGRFLYTVGPGVDAVNILEIVSPGRIRSVNAHSTESAPQSVAVHPRHPVVYVVNGGSGTLTYYSIMGNGELTFLGVILTGASPRGITLNLTGTHAYVANEGSNTISMYGLDGSGIPASAGSVAAGSSPQMVALHPLGTHAYAVNSVSGDVSMYSINAGVLVPNGTAAAAVGAGFMSVHPSGQYGYVANAGADTITRFTISSGVLMPAGTTATGSVPTCVQVAPGGQTATCTNSGSHELWTYAIAPDGSLTLIEKVRSRKSPNFITFMEGPPPTPQATHLYVSNGDDDTISKFSVSPTTGALTSQGTTATQISPGVGAVSLTGEVLWIPNLGSNSVTRYSLDSSGALTLLGTSATASGPRFVTPELTTLGLYVVNGLAGTVTHSQTGPIPPGSLGFTMSIAAGSDPRMVELDPTGRFGYVPDPASDSLSLFLTTPLGPPTAISTPDEPVEAVADPRGRFLYLTARSAGSITGYSIHPVTGALTTIQTLPTGGSPTGIAIEPSGRWLYQLDEAGDSIGRYEIASSTGMLTSFGSTPAGVLPSSIRVDPSGSFLYVTNGGASTVSVYTIDALTGGLSAPSSFPTGANPRGLMFRTVLQ